MTIIPCPHCKNSIQITAVNPAPGSDVSLGSREMKAVLEFMRNHRPGRHNSTDLFTAYENWREGMSWPGITQAAFGRALRANGATPWRTGQGRGWDLPEIKEDQKAARPARSVREEEAQRSYRDTVTDGGPRPAPKVDKPFEYSDLPFEIEIPE